MVADRLGYQPETALTLGRFVARSSARAKARRLGISDEKKDAEERRARAAESKPLRQTVHLLGQDIPVLDADVGTLRVACFWAPPITADPNRSLSAAFLSSSADPLAAPERSLINARQLPGERLNDQA